MDQSMKYQLGLDIGASSIKYGYGNCQQGLQHFAIHPIPTRSLDCLHDCVAAILRECERIPGRGHIDAIGIGTPGMLETSSGELVGVNPNLPFWSGHSPRDLIPADWSVPIACDNDGNLMCLGESWLRGLQGLNIGIAIGSGIGGGLVMDGRIFRGAHGWALEIGHLTSVPGGVPCSCGRLGCLEAYAAVEGLRRRTSELGLWPADQTPELKDILQRQEQSPPLTDIIRDGRNALARVIVDLVVLLDPDRVILGGGAMDAGLYDLEELRRLVEDHLPQHNRGRFSLEAAQIGNRAGVWGAIILASQFLGTKTE